MRIKTITCHDVYNVGASLQAYALATYLIQQGNQVEIINYEPKYLQHYRLSGISNPAYDKPILREVYQILKFPERLLARFRKRKKVFDSFTKNFLPITACKYESNEELKKCDLDAELFLAGSDQIWNPLFQNGKDPAFFLDFVPQNAKKASYAASFAVETISENDSVRMKNWLKDFDAISVRETSGLNLLDKMGLSGRLVCDPVFLLNTGFWKNEMHTFGEENYLFVYDFDTSEQMSFFADVISKRKDIEIVSMFPMRKTAKVCSDIGPLDFLGAIYGADVVLSNSFHATAFALIFHKEFFVVNRQEQINARMHDLLKYVGLEDRILHAECEIDQVKRIDWKNVDSRLASLIHQSKEYLDELTSDSMKS